MIQQFHSWVYMQRWKTLIQKDTCIPMFISSVHSFSPVQLADPLDRSAAGLPVHHQLLEFAQTHVHRVGDAIHPILCHPLLLPPSIFPSIRVSLKCSQPLANTIQLSASLNLHFIYVSGTRRYSSHCDWLFCPRIITSNFTHVVTCVRIPFFFKAQYYSTVLHTTFCLCVHPLVAS